MTDTKRIKLFKRHQTGKIGWWEGTVITTDNGQVTIVTKSAGSDDAKPITHSEDIQGKNIGRANETTSYEQACKELDSKANKKRDNGYMDKLEQVGKEATNTLGFTKPQKAKAYKDISDRILDKIDWENAYVQRKLDGHRAMVKDGVMYSSAGKPIELPHLTNLPTELHLDGELYIHGMRLQDISKLVKKYRPGETEKLEYHIFDNVSNRPFYERSLKLVPVITGLPLVRVETKKVSNMEEVMAYHKQFLAEGYEGTMLRQGTNPYKGGARNTDIIKIKDMSDAEWVITDVLEGKKKDHQGTRYRQARFQCYDTTAQKHFYVLAHGTVPEKQKPLLRPEDYKGKMLTVQHFGLTADGLPNLPVAKCLREDL